MSTQALLEVVGVTTQLVFLDSFLVQLRPDKTKEAKTNSENQK